MKKQLITTLAPTRVMLHAALSSLFLFPAASYAAVGDGPIRLSVPTYLLLAFLLILSLVMFFIFQRRFNNTRHELQDITAELDTTRTRLAETAQDLEHTQKDLKATTSRYQGILFDAGVGMFQIDLDGKCTYINNTLQEFSGLYLKKAQQEGLASVVHPEDRSRFEDAWQAFVEGNEPFQQNFRLQYKRGRKVRDVYVSCRASKVLNSKKEPESYIGWITDVTLFHQLQLQEQLNANRYHHFVDEILESYFRLVPEQPIPLTSSASKMADEIMDKMTLLDCSDTFAAMYGAKADELQGKVISELHDGCGPFKNKQDLIYFVEDGYKAAETESVRQDPSGTRLILLNDVIGIIEDNKLIGIWGSQRDISRQKRETAEQNSQIHFLHHILNTLPADVHVKDTRCRYLYASKKLADRTGIAQEEWIGKTIHEVIPGTSRDHDQHAIDAMKSGKLNRIERPYEVRGKSGWMETSQIPLVSDEGLVEGVIGLSLEITDRKTREAEAHKKHTDLERLLKQTRNDLNESRNKHNQTNTALSDALRKLKVADAEKTSREHQYKEHLEELRLTEESLRRSEENLLTRQHHLEEQLSKRLSELGAETDKRKKWEELLKIKEEELQKAEDLSKDLGQQLAETEDFLQNTQEQLVQITEQHSREVAKEVASREAATKELDHIRQQLDQSDAKWKSEIESITSSHKSELGEEHKIRTSAEKRLAKTENLLQKTQEEIMQMSERHAKELEAEVAERKAAAEKLIHSMEELDDLRQQFHIRIEEETKSIKHELAQKQIREKALRQHEKDLEGRIKELEGTLQMKAQEFAEQIQAREGAEVQKKQIEQQLEQMTKRQKELVARETQKLQLHIAEIRLEEVKLRKVAGDLQREKESLEESLQQRNGELENAAEKQQGTEALLNETKLQLKKLSDDQNTLIAAETEALRQQLMEVKRHGEELQGKLKKLQQSRQDLEHTLGERDAKLENVRKEHKETNAALTETRTKLQQLVDNQSRTLDAQTKELRSQLEQKQQTSDKLQQQLEELGKEKQALEEHLEVRTQDLAKAAREYRKVVDAYKGSQAKLKQLDESREAVLAEKTNALQSELERLKQTQKDLLSKGEKLEAHVEKQQKRIKEQTVSLETEQANRRQAEKDLQNLQAAVESDRENAAALVQEQTRALKNRITNLERIEEQFKQKLEKTQQVVEQRDEVLATMKTERKQAEDRIKEIEKRLAGIHEEHQADLKKSMAEVKKISQLNSQLVDELNDALQETLNPVVKTTILMEKAENLSQEQKQDMLNANLSCRQLIDMMNYRCELTHIADGSDKMDVGKCDLHGLMTDIDRQFSHRAETKKLFFAVSFAQYQAAHNVPKHVETDELKIRKVLSILLGYALETTDKGRLGLHAARKSCAGDTANITFELAYTGKKRNDDLLNSIFGKEHADSDTVDMKYGLTLARRYVGMLGGEFKLEYRSGGITALTLQFPFKKVGSEAISANNDEKRAGAA